MKLKPQPGPTSSIKIFLLAVVHDAVRALDRGAGYAADAVARRVVGPAGIAVANATPGAVEVVGPHSVPGDTYVGVIDGSRGVARPDIDPGLRVSLC